MIRPKLKNGYFDTGDIGIYNNGELTTLKKERRAKKGAEIVSLPYIENIIIKIIWMMPLQK